MAFKSVGHGYAGAGGETFMSSALAESSLGQSTKASTTTRQPIRRLPARPSMSSEARSAWEQAMAYYAPGGGYGKGVEAGLERGRTKALASGMQSLVSAGLSNTTMPAGLGKKYEEEVAMPARAQVESTRAQAIAGLKAGFAGALQSGYESAAGRALTQNLAGTQTTTREYGQMPSSQRIGPDELALQEALAKMRQQTTQQSASPQGRIPNPYMSAGASGPSAYERSVKGTIYEGQDWSGRNYTDAELMKMNPR